MKRSSSQTLGCSLFHSHSFSESWFCSQGLFFLCFMGRIIWATGSGLFPCLIVPDDVKVALFVVTFCSALVCNTDFWSMLCSGKIKTPTCVMQLSQHSKMGTINCPTLWCALEVSTETIFLFCIKQMCSLHRLSSLMFYGRWLWEANILARNALVELVLKASRCKRVGLALH